MSANVEQEKPVLPPVSDALNWEKMREDGYKTVDFIVNYHKSLEEKRIPVVASGIVPGNVEKVLGGEGAAPESGKNWDSVLDDISKGVVPGLMHWQHPDFFGFFPCLTSPPALMGEMIAGGFSQPGFTWQCSPSATELELMVMDWLAAAFDLPDVFKWKNEGGGVLQATATEGCIVALLAAKNKFLSQFSTHEEKIQASTKLVCYYGDQAHFCIQKAANILGIPYVRAIPCVDDGSGNIPMNPDTLQDIIDSDKAAGLSPFLICASYGSTGTCTVDPLDKIATVSEKNDCWFVVDAAYAGVTAMCPEMRSNMKGVERADLLIVNGSKWMGILFNTSLMFFREKKYICSSLNASGVYLNNKESAAGDVVDLKDYQLGLGRPFRSLKVYTAIQSFGLEGFRSLIRRHVLLAKYLAQSIASVTTLEVVGRVEFGLVCFRKRHPATNEDNLGMMNRLKVDGQVFLVHTVCGGKVTLRVSLSYPKLDFSDIDALVQKIKAAM